MPVVTDGVSARDMGEDFLSDSDNKNSDDSLHTKIKRLTDKKKNGLRLTDDEIHELARLNRVKASRKYRQKEKIEKQQRSKQPCHSPHPAPRRPLLGLPGGAPSAMGRG